MRLLNSNPNYYEYLLDRNSDSSTSSSSNTISTSFPNSYSSSSQAVEPQPQPRACPVSYRTTLVFEANKKPPAHYHQNNNFYFDQSDEIRVVDQLDKNERIILKGAPPAHSSRIQANVRRPASMAPYYLHDSSLQAAMNLNVDRLYSYDQHRGPDFQRPRVCNVHHHYHDPYYRPDPFRQSNPPAAATERQQQQPVYENEYYDINRLQSQEVKRQASDRKPTRPVVHQQQKQVTTHVEPSKKVKPPVLKPKPTLVNQPSRDAAAVDLSGYLIFVTTNLRGSVRVYGKLSSEKKEREQA